MKKLLFITLSLILISCSDEIDETQSFDVTEIYYCNSNNKIIDEETLKGTFIEFRLNDAQEVGGIQIYTSTDKEDIPGFSDYYRIDKIITNEDNGSIFGLRINDVQDEKGNQIKVISYCVVITPDGLVAIAPFDYPNPNPDCHIVYKVKTPLEIEVDSKFPRYNDEDNIRNISSVYSVLGNNEKDAKTFIVTNAYINENGVTTEEEILPNMKYVFSENKIVMTASEPETKMIYEVKGVTNAENRKVFTTIINGNVVFISLFNDHKTIYIKPRTKKFWLINSINEVNSNEDINSSNNTLLERAKTTDKKTFEEQMEQYKKDNDWGD